VREDKKTIFYAWFENVHNERILIRILNELEELEHPVNNVKLIGIPPEAIRFNVGFLLRQFDVGFTLNALSIDQVKRTNLYWVAVAIALTLAATITIAFIKWVFRYRQKTAAIGVALIAGVLLLGVLMPGNALLGLFDHSLAFFSIDRKFIPALSDAQNVGHVVGFFLLALVVLQFGAVAQANLMDVFIKLVLFAILAEALQRHSVLRSPNILDVGFNLAGLLLGTACWCWFHRERHNELS